MIYSLTYYQKRRESKVYFVMYSLRSVGPRSHLDCESLAIVSFLSITFIDQPFTDHYFEPIQVRTFLFCFCFFPFLFHCTCTCIYMYPYVCLRMCVCMCVWVYVVICVCNHLQFLGHECLIKNSLGH